MAMPEKERKQLLGLLIALAIGAPGAFWIYWRTPQVAEAAGMQDRIDSLRAKVDTARADLREGTVEQLRQTVDRYGRALSVMRELVPVENEVTSLIDSVSTQARLRGVEIRELSPQTPELAPPFQIQRYRLTVVGGYDEVGEFLSDVAALRRIMVPYEVSMQIAQPGELAGLMIQEGVTYLRVSFMIRTFVKTGANDVGGTGGDG